MTTPVEDLTFEETLSELETIVQQLESGELKLEETVSFYQRGQQLAAHCQALLDDVELRVQQLQPDGTVTAFGEAEGS
jgi:exodeoxyribonuclease VII small subunit